MASFRSKVCHLSHRWAKVSDDTNRSEYVWRMYSSGAASTWWQATALWDHQVDVWFVVDRRKRPVGPRESVRRVAFTQPVAGLNWCCGRIRTVIPVSIVGSTTAAELPPQNACHTNLQNYQEWVIHVLISLGISSGYTTIYLFNFIHLAVVVYQTYKITWISENIWPYSSSRSFKTIDLGVNQMHTCNFLSLTY